MSSGEKASDVKAVSIWNKQIRICLLNLTYNLEIAIRNNDKRSIDYFLGLLTRCKYHPTLNWNTLVPIDVLLLQKAPSCHRKRHKRHSSKSQTSKRKSEIDKGLRCRGNGGELRRTSKKKKNSKSQSSTTSCIPSTTTSTTSTSSGESGINELL